MLLFLHVFISSDVFGCFHCWLHFFTWLFLHCLSGTSFLCCCIASATDLRERFFSLKRASFTFMISINVSLEQAALPWRLQGFPLRFQIQTRPSFCLNHTVFSKYMISKELYLNLSKYVDILHVGKSVINFQNFS